jgi:excisionase family DNA binding protein
MPSERGTRAPHDAIGTGIGRRPETDPVEHSDGQISASPASWHGTEREPTADAASAGARQQTPDRSTRGAGVKTEARPAGRRVATSLDAGEHGDTLSVAGRPHRPAEDLPTLLTADETAALLRTSRKAIYVMVERHQLPGVLRLGRRLLIQRESLLDWLHQKSASSLQESQR